MVTRYVYVKKFEFVGWIYIIEDLCVGIARVILFVAIGMAAPRVCVRKYNMRGVGA